MKLSFSTNAFVRRTIFEAVEKIAHAGYPGVEILADSPHLYGPEVTRKELERLKASLVELGIRVANINANTAVGYYGQNFWEPLFEPSLANPEEEKRQWRIAYTKQCIDMAFYLSAPCISITSGRMVPGTPPEEGLELFKASLGDILPYAAIKGIRIGIEYEPGLLIERCEELVSLFGEMGSPFLGANLDLGHSHVLGEDASEVIRAFGDRLFHIHLEDIRDRKHYHLIPGEGDMNFEAVFSTLRQCGYDGFVTVELYTYPETPEDAARRSLAHLSGIIGD